MEKETISFLGIKPICCRVILVEWNSVRESLNARYAAREMFPSIMISLHYFVIPSSAEFVAHPNRYTNALAPIHTCLHNIAESSAAIKRNSDKTYFSPGITANFSLFKYAVSEEENSAASIHHSISLIKYLTFCIPKMLCLLSSFNYIY